MPVVWGKKEAMVDGSAIVVGASGQDGLILSRVLARRGLHVIGIASHRASNENLENLFPEVEWAFSDPRGQLPLERFPSSASVVIHLGGRSSVADSWNEPSLSYLANVYPSLQASDFCAKKDIPLVFAASSEMYARERNRIDENSPRTPSSPYGAAKAGAYELLRLLRLQKGLIFSALIMFNHESPLRPRTFASRRLSDQILAVHTGQASGVHVGNLTSAKDFSWAPDFVRVMANSTLWNSNEDFVLASGELTSIRELALPALAKFNLSETILLQDADYSRPFDWHPVGCSDKAREMLGFEGKISSGQIIPKMVDMLERVNHLTPFERKRELTNELASEVEESNS